MGRFVIHFSLLPPLPHLSSPLLSFPRGSRHVALTTVIQVSYIRMASWGLVSGRFGGGSKVVGFFSSSLSFALVFCFSWCSPSFGRWSYIVIYFVSLEFYVHWLHRPRGWGEAATSDHNKASKCRRGSRVGVGFVEKKIKHKVQLSPSTSAPSPWRVQTLLISHASQELVGAAKESPTTSTISKYGNFLYHAQVLRARSTRSRRKAREFARLAY